MSGLRSKPSVNPNIQRLRIDRSNDSLLTHQVERTLTDLVRDGTLRPGDKLPHEEQVAAHLKVSRWTVAKAMTRLVDKGVIRRTRRAGTFVTEHAMRSRDVGFFYFQEAADELINGIHRMHHALAARKYDLRTVPFPFDYYERADLFVEIRRLNLAGAVLVALNTPGCHRQLLRLEEHGFPYVRLGNKCFIGRLRARLREGPLNKGGNPNVLAAGR